MDAILGLTFLFQGISGFILWLVLPRGSGGRYRGDAGESGEISTFLFSRHTWLDIHEWAAVALLVMLALHIAIHWRWIVYMTKSYFGHHNQA
jgi:hypothetical protein